MTQGTNKRFFGIQSAAGRDYINSPSRKSTMQNIAPEILERLAEAAHQVWMEGKLREGWKYGPVIDKEKKIHNCLIPYDQLDETDKESDRDFVRGIPKILAAAGYKMVEGEAQDRDRQ